jgi:chitin disaccharide deacetylase
VGGPGQPETVAQLMRAIALRRVDIHGTLRAQIERIVKTGLRPTHLDTHKHTHLLPPVLDAVARLGEEFGVTWVRRPFDLPLTGAPAEVPLAKRMISAAFRSVRGQFHSKLARHGCRTTDWFAGFQITGRFGAADVVRLIENLPEGATEFMVHPGYCREQLRAARTRLKESREAELRALTAPEVREAVARAGVELRGYATL